MNIGEKIKEYRGRLSALLTAAVVALLGAADATGLVDVPGICAGTVEPVAIEASQ